MFTTVDIRKLQDRLDEITNKTEVIESEEVAELEEAGGYIGQMNDPIMYKGKEIDVDRLDYDMQDISDGIYEINAPAYYTDGTEVDDADMAELEELPELNDYIMQDYMDRQAPQAEAVEDTVDEASPEEVTNSGREEDEATRAGRLDRDNIKLGDVKTGIESVLSELLKDKDEWYGRYEEMENELRAEDPGITDAAMQQAIYDMDDDIVSYVNIDDIEDKIEALERLMKTADADGNDIVQTAEFGVGDTVPQEELMRDIKAAIKQNHPEVYSKLFMYDIDESAGATESIAQEGDAELDELKGMLGRSGVMGSTQ